MVQSSANTPIMVADAPRAMAKLVASASQSSTTNDAPFRLTVDTTAALLNVGGTFLSIASGWIQIAVAGWYDVAGFASNTSGNRIGDRNVIIQTTTGTPTPATDAVLVRVETTADQNTCHMATGWWPLHFAAGARIYLSFVQHTTLATPYTIAFNEDADAPFSWLAARLIAAD